MRQPFWTGTSLPFSKFQRGLLAQKVGGSRVRVLLYHQKNSPKCAIREGHSLALEVAFHLLCQCQSYNRFHSYFSSNFELNLIHPAAPESIHDLCFAECFGQQSTLIPPAGVSLCTQEEPDWNWPPVFGTVNFIWPRKPVLPHSTFLNISPLVPWTIFSLNSIFFEQYFPCTA